MTEAATPSIDSTVRKDPVFADRRLLLAALERSKRLALHSADHSTFRNLAETHRKLGNLDEAAAAYARTVELDPQDSESVYLQALLADNPRPGAPKGMKPAPFILVKNFLPHDFHDTLIPFVLANQSKFVSSRVGRHAEYKPDVRMSLEYSERWADGDRFVRHLLSIPDILPRLDLSHEVFDVAAVRVRIYLDGHFFRVHVDAEPNSPSANRLYAFVYFFQRTPRPYEGGELLLFDTDYDAMTLSRTRFTCILPEDNSIVLFPATYFHAVLPVRVASGELADSRFVVNGLVSRHVNGTQGAEHASPSRID
jgi:Rps23 Pro-64 3,4-dihydroxylase Tpa1-like proline 4-hydroxylase